MYVENFANAEGVAAAIGRSQIHFRPPPKQLVSEWTEKNVLIPEGNAVPGPMRLANAPYQREPMDMFNDPDCTRVTLKWGAQVGKTMLGLCVQGYCIEVQPKSQMMMQPSNGDLQTWVQTKWNPLVQANRKLRRLIAKPRGRDGVNNGLMKSYPGGFLMFAWSGSAKTMRGRSAPLIVCDEVDGYEVTKEGHPVQILWQRAATFLDQRFLLEISTPTIKGVSYIDAAYEQGDQRQFHICCPNCQTHQTLKWSNVSWTGRRSTSIADAELDLEHDEHLVETATYHCNVCGETMDDGQRIAALRTAERDGAGWKASKPFKGHASYHINELYSTFRRLRDIVQSYFDKLKTSDLQTFVNVSLAETWEEKGEQVDATGLLQRCKAFAAQVPMGGVYLTAGIDMQQDRLEVEVVAWGIGEESWSIGYYVLWGDPLQADVWNDLDDLLQETFEHESGASLPIMAACLDTGGTGGYTQAAYDYAKGRTGRRLFAVKGGGTWGSPIVASPSRRKSGMRARKVDLFIVGADEAKLTTMRRLNVSRPGPGYCHFPEGREEDYFKQLTAETLVTRYVRGFAVREWRKPNRARNEALDCRVYALAALKIMNPNLKKLTERMVVPVADDAPEDQPDAPPPPPPPARRPTPAPAPRPAPVPVPKPAPEPENPQEEAKPERRDTRGSQRPRRSRPKSGGGTYATKW